jgi:hypothetical protein
MRTLIVIAGLFLLAGLPTAARAQCAVGCESSSSCAGTGKSGCITHCDGKGTCGCADSSCPTQLRPVTLHLDATGDPLLASFADDTPAAVLVDCHGNVLEVRFPGRDGQARLGELSSIPIRRARGTPGRFAARE